MTFTAPTCPYPGMQPFTAAEQARFYGRKAEIGQAVDRLRRHPFLAVIGPSGSGKSSLLAAGILPALAESHHFAPKPWVVHTMRPGATPRSTLAGLVDLPVVAARRPLGRMVGHLVRTGRSQSSPGDAHAAGRRPIRGAVHRSAGRRTRPVRAALLQLQAADDFYLVIAARADFYANLMASPLWDQIRTHRLEVTPPHGDALREAIELPARAVGVELQPALVERLLADAGEEPGVLPFIQETLVMLWSARRQAGDRSRRLHRSGGRQERALGAAGGAGRARRACLSRCAGQRRRAGHGQAHSAAAAAVWPGPPRHTAPADGRRAAHGNEHSQRGLEHVLAALTANRLLTLSDEARRVDLSHEALIRGWPRLHQWIDERRAAELTRRRLEEKAEERQRLRQDDGERRAAGRGGAGRGRGVGQRSGCDRSGRERRAGRRWSLTVGRSIDAAVLAKERAAERLRRRNQGLAIALAAALLAMAVAVVFFHQLTATRRQKRGARIRGHSRGRTRLPPSAPKPQPRLGVSRRKTPRSTRSLKA